LLLVRSAHIIEFGQINQSRVSPNVFRKAFGVCLDLVSLQVHLRLENDELFFQALFIQTSEMIFMEVVLQCVVVNIVLLLTVGGASVTDVAPFVFIATVGVQLIVTIEPLTTETTFGVSLEATLVYSSRLVISGPFVLTQFHHGK
jgi:hypothetical protein